MKISSKETRRRCFNKIRLQKTRFIVNDGLIKTGFQEMITPIATELSSPSFYEIKCMKICGPKSWLTCM